MDRLHYCHLAEIFVLTPTDINRRIYNKKFSCQIPKDYYNFTIQQMYDFFCNIIIDNIYSIIQ